jgi:hypothetical protein
MIASRCRLPSSLFIDRRPAKPRASERHSIAQCTTSLYYLHDYVHGNARPIPSEPPFHEINMAFEDTSPSPLLALPLELRLIIYEQLLSPEPRNVYTLYHDRFRRDAFPGKKSTERRCRDWRKIVFPPVDTALLRAIRSFEPMILQVNRQIHSEAIPILYENNRYRIYLATPLGLRDTVSDYPHYLAVYEGLFRTDTDEIVLDPEQHPGSSRARMIYPHCFRRLRHINLISARDVIWLILDDGYYFSQVGETIWKILQVLADAQATEARSKQYLTFTIQKDGLRDGEEPQKGYKDLEKETRPILGMMKALQRRIEIEIEVEEETFTKPLREMWMEEGEVDKWDHALMSDMSKSRGNSYTVSDGTVFHTR